MADRKRYEFGQPERLKLGQDAWHRVIGEGLPAAGVYVRFGHASDGRLACLGVHVGAPGGDAEVTATDLRRIPLAAVLGDAAAYLTGEAASDPLEKAIMRKMAGDVLVQHATPLGPRTRSSRLPAEHFERVAGQYRAALVAAPGRPIQYLSERSNTPEPTLRRWVQRARDMGLLGASTPGKAGEVAPAKRTRRKR